MLMAMNALFTLTPEAVAVAAPADKAELMKMLAARFAESYSLDSGDVFDAIEEREKLGSTGFGRGYAVPHARLKGLSEPMVAVLKLAKPIDFVSADGQPVDIVFGLLSPEDGGAAHLHALAAISRIMRNETMHNRLRAAPDDEAIFALLANSIDRDAA